MRPEIVVAVALLVAPLAGCVGGDGGADGEASGPMEAEGPGTGDVDAVDGLQAPSWSIGDYWTFSTSQGRQDTWVVTGEDGADWIVDTTSRETAFFDARSDISFLGPIRKADLAGSQNDTRVEFYDWPLEEGKTWTTTWDQVEREITVEQVDETSAELVARQDGRVAVEYTYDAEAGHFGAFTFLDANGTETFAAELEDAGANRTEPAVRWELETIEDRAESFGAEPRSWGGSFTVPENTTDIWLGFTVDCPSGAYSFGISRQETGEGYEETAQCPSDSFVEEVIAEEPEGTWNYGMTAISPEEDGHYEVTILLRDLVEVAVGEG